MSTLKRTRNSDDELEQLPIKTGDLSHEEEFVMVLRLILEVMVTMMGSDRTTVTLSDALDTIVNCSQASFEKRRKRGLPDRQMVQDCLVEFLDNRKMDRLVLTMSVSDPERTSPLALLFAFDRAYGCNRFSECILKLQDIVEQNPGPIIEVIAKATHRWAVCDYKAGSVRVERDTGNLYLPVVNNHIINKFGRVVEELRFRNPDLAVKQLTNLALAISFDNEDQDPSPTKRMKIGVEDDKEEGKGKSKEEDDDDDGDDIQVIEMNK